MSDSSSQPHGDQPSLIGGHAKYIAGAASSLFGNKSGDETKDEAVKEMRAANEQSSTDDSTSQNSSILGTVEQKVGELVGCEGMEKEGAQSSETSDRVGAQGS